MVYTVGAVGASPIAICRPALQLLGQLHDQLFQNSMTRLNFQGGGPECVAGGSLCAQSSGQFSRSFLAVQSMLGISICDGAIMWQFDISPNKHVHTLAQGEEEEEIHYVHTASKGL